MSTRWPRGSEWRKWDLHVHPPGTKLNNQYRLASRSAEWDAFCRTLHDSDVQVFGIADYFSADGYFAALSEYMSRYPTSPKLLLPNIELRTTDVVNKEQEEVNVHLLFNPFSSHHQEKIISFLGTLETSKTDRSGRHVRASELNGESAFAEATTTRTFLREALVDTYGKDADLLDYLLVITAANNDGIRPERGKKRKLLITDELDKFSDCFFGSSRNVSYFLNPNRAEDGQPIKPKPVLSGCDAHSFSELDERLGQVVSSKTDGIVHEPTWIKADPTFEGLKQIIFEPSNRVFIGAEPDVERRVRENKTRYLESLHITSVEGYAAQHGAWFDDEEILLGKELVAIIGNKGSGKSALTDIVGLLANSHNQSSRSKTGQRSEELFSFLTREKFLKGGCAKHFQGSIRWYEGEPDIGLLDAEVALHLPQRVEYLPQKYLERVCSNIADDEFRRTLNEVIFRYVRPQNQHGRSSLEELIQYLTQQALEDIAQAKQELRLANAAVAAVEKSSVVITERSLRRRSNLRKRTWLRMRMPGPRRGQIPEHKRER